MKKVYVADFTLKALAEERTLPLLFREKLAVARSLDGLGVDAVELAPVKNVKEDRIICKTMASSLESCRLCIPAGFSKETVDTAWECIKTAKNPCLQVELPVSAVQMEYVCGIKKQALDAKITELVTYAKEKCGDVEFVELTEDMVVKCRLQGACHGCPHAQATIKGGIERILQEQYPEVKAVESVE